MLFSPLFFKGMTKGSKDSATGKTEPRNPALPINIPVLSLDELIEKTDDFGLKALIGEGSYGRVYYAVLDNGTKLAVKKLDSTENVPTSEFLTQVGLLLRLELFFWLYHGCFSTDEGFLNSDAYFLMLGFFGFKIET